MALEVWPLSVFVVFVLLWLRRRCAARRRASMVEDMAARARILRFTAAQSQQRLFLYALLSRRLSTACLQRRTVWARQRNRSYLDYLAAKYIHFPTGQGLRTIFDDFESKWGFPQCTGAIDGSHIPMIAPAENALGLLQPKGVPFRYTASSCGSRIQVFRCMCGLARQCARC